MEERERIDPAVKPYERGNTAAGWGAWKVGDKDGDGVVRLGEGGKVVIVLQLCAQVRYQIMNLYKANVVQLGLGLN